MSILFAIFVVSYLFPHPKIEAKPEVALFGNSSENYYMRFYPNIDLTSQFNWNTKQIFVYAISKTDERDDMAWSQLVQKHDKKVLNTKVSANYRFRIASGQKPTFEMRGNIYPYVGRMIDVSFGEFSPKLKNE